MTEHLTEVELTDEQCLRASELYADPAFSEGSGGRGYLAARLIVHLQDKVTELERLVEAVRSDDEGEQYMGSDWHERARAAVTTDGTP